MPKKPVPIVLADGKTRHLCFDYNALCALEDEMDISLGELWNKLQGTGSGSLRLIRALVWAGLLHEGEKLTTRQVGELIEFDKVGEISTTVAEGFAAAFNVEGELKNGAAPSPVESGTGSDT